MPTFVYTIKDPQGRVQTRSTKAENRRVLTTKLRGEGLTVTDIRQEKKLPSLNIFRPRVKTNDIAIFSRSFATMVDAGITLPKCLDILVKQTENPVLSKAIADIKTDVEGGISLSEALGKYPKIFPALYTNMVKAGEIGGTLPEVCNQLANILEKQRQLQNKVKSGLFMPIMVLSFCMLITVGLILFVVPRFAAIFSDMNAELPAPTQVLVNISDGIRGPKGIGFVAILAVFIFIFVKVIKTDKGGNAWDKIKLKMPLFGPLITKNIVANFTRTFGMLQKSGVPILESLNIVADTAGNRIIAAAIRDASSSIRQGETIAKPLERSQALPLMVTQMIAVGEETGNVELMLNKIADLYEDDVERTVEGLTKLIEPMMMVFIGSIVGGILVCLYLPIFNMADVMSGGM